VLALAAALIAGEAAGQVSARLERSHLTVGESTTLHIVVEGTDAEDPGLELPPGLEVLGSSRSKNVSWINGKLSSQTVFRYEIGPTEAGRFEIGPILVRAKQETFRSGVLTLSVTAAERSVGGRGAGPASLSVEAIPSDPVVGQLVMLRVRLIQRVAFAEDPQYTPPTTSGFWTDKPSAPESFYADQDGERVLVTETRMRLYPVASGTATIGQAAASVVVAAGGLDDPFAWLSGRARRELVVRSRPTQVRVRPLPAGAPPSFTGAVGAFDVAWSPDRARTSRDVPITLRLEVRGRGNLPLVRPPELDDPDVEVFARTVEDSLSEPGTDLPGRKRFQWTVLPRRQGTLTIAAPEFAWYDPAARAWRHVRAEPVTVEVGPPIFSGAQGAGEFPAHLAREPLDPGARRAAPWAWALGGLVFGAAVALWRTGGARAAHGAERAQQLEWLRAIGRASGPDFWRAADEAAFWLEEHGQLVSAVRERIAAARYARTTDADAEPVRRRLVEQLSRAMAPAHPRAALRLAAIVLAVGAIAWLWLFRPAEGDPGARRLALEADQSARAGELNPARANWLSLWRAGHRHPALAARLAWSEVERGALGPASLWVLRGEAAEPRDPALAWATERVREAGGLVGSSAPRAPITSLEWSIAALLLGVLAGALWPRRRAALAAAVLLVVAGAWQPVEGWWIEHSGRAVVMRAAALEGEGIELQPGQVVTVEASREGRARVTAGDAVRGWLPADAIGRL